MPGFQLKAAMMAASVPAALFAIGVLNAPVSRAQSARSPAKFEVASIKACRAEDGGDGGRGNKSGGAGGAGGISWSPGRFHWECGTVYNFIRDAYLAYPEGKPWAADSRATPSPSARGLTDRGCVGCGVGMPPVSDRTLRQPLKGSPDWVNSDRFAIDAKTDGPATPEMMRGPMMQALLEDRFKLKIRRDSEAAPVYELTVPPGGAKLQPSPEGSCVVFEPGKLPPPAPGTPRARFCGSVMMQAAKKESEFLGMTVGSFCRNLSNLFDRDVIDKTGIAGIFDFHIDASRVALPVADPSSGDPADGRPARPPETDLAATFKVFQAALPKLGLKLEPARGSGLVLVIDHIERHPSEN